MEARQIKKQPGGKSRYETRGSAGGFAGFMKKAFTIIFLLIIAAVIIRFLTSVINKPASVQTTLTELHPTDLTDSITVKGTVESIDKKNVYTTLGFRIQEVDAHVGDRVEEGQVLCILDTADLDLSIQQLKAQLQVSQQTSLNQYENNQRIYDQASSDLSSNSNPQVVTAQNAVNTAKVNLQNAQRVYDEAVNDFNNSTDPNVTAAESALASAKLDLDSKEQTNSNNEILYNNGVISQSEYQQSQDLYNDAQNKYDDAQKTLDNAKTAQSRSLDQAKNNLDAANAAYKSASDTYKTASETAKQQLDTYKSNLDSSEIALNQDSMLLNIQQLEKQEADSTIKAPSSGTVTAVYATEGSVGSGLLFVIEDTDHLQITGNVKEYDYPNVKMGMDVIIQSDATGDNEYKGEVSQIDPAATKDALGQTQSNGDVQFGITVAITSEDTPLRIGMSANLSLVVAQKSDIFCVRYDAVVQNEKGQNVIFAAESSDSGVYQFQQIVVDIGISNDIYLEVSGDKIKEGLQVVNDASIITDELTKYGKTFDEVGELRFSLT